MRAASSDGFVAPSGQGVGFYTGDDGYLYCDSLRVDNVRGQVGSLYLCVLLWRGVR